MRLEQVILDERRVDAPSQSGDFRPLFPDEVLENFGGRHFRDASMIDRARISKAGGGR